jgi:hypothetical protein
MTLFKIYSASDTKETYECFHIQNRLFYKSFVAIYRVILELMKSKQNLLHY